MPEQKRVLVCGSLGEAPEWVPTFIKTLGFKIVSHPDLALVTGGLKKKPDGTGTADKFVVAGAKKYLEAKSLDLSERIITMLPHRDFPGAKRLTSGRVIKVKDSNTTSRRYSMVLTSDAFIAVSGSTGTGNMIDLAWVAEKPVLPVPATGGAAQKKWESLWMQLKKRCDIHQEEIEVLTSNDPEPSHLADTCMEIIRRNLKSQCFIAMKIDGHPLEGCIETIRRELKDKGYAPVRIDQESISGDIMEAMRKSIRHSSYLIVDLWDYSPNVLYELGIAHGLDKEVLLIFYDKDGRMPENVPFDLRVQRIHAYGTTDSLAAIIRNNIPGSTR